MRADEASGVSNCSRELLDVCDFAPMSSTLHEQSIQSFLLDGMVVDWLGEKRLTNDPELFTVSFENLVPSW
jgi:hypothetical protein